MVYKTPVLIESQGNASRGNPNLYSLIAPKVEGNLIIFNRGRSEMRALKKNLLGAICGMTVDNVDTVDRWIERRLSVNMSC